MGVLGGLLVNGLSQKTRLEPSGSSLSVVSMVRDPLTPPSPPLPREGQKEIIKSYSQNHFNLVEAGITAQKSEAILL